MRHLFLDLDETLISAIELHNGNLAEVVPDENLLQSFDMGHEFRIFLRPGFDNFLKTISQTMPVSIWSAGSKEYVIDIAEKVDPLLVDGLTSLFWSAHCQASQKATGCLKSFGWLEKQIPCILTFGQPLLIDDLADNCNTQEHLAIQIKPFRATENGSSNDSSLADLTPRLINAAQKK